MKLILFLALALTGFSAQANWTHKNVINEVVGFYQSPQNPQAQFAMRLRVGNNLEIAYNFGNGDGRMYIQCEATEDSVYNCMGSNGNQNVQVMIGKLPAYSYAVVSVNGREMADAYLKMPNYNLRY